MGDITVTAVVLSSNSQLLLEVL